MDPKKIFPEPLRRIRSLLKDARIGSYGAQAAFFVLLSAMPFLVFLSAILHYVPWSSADLIRFLPDSLKSAAELLPGETPPPPCFPSPPSPPFGPPPGGS